MQLLFRQQYILAALVFAQVDQNTVVFQRVRNDQTSLLNIADGFTLAKLDPAEWCRAGRIRALFLGGGKTHLDHPALSLYNQAQTQFRFRAANPSLPDGKDGDAVSQNRSCHCARCVAARSLLG